MDDMLKELDIPANQLLAIYNKTLRQISEYFTETRMEAVRQKLDAESGQKSRSADVEMQPLPISLEASIPVIIYSLKNSLLFSKFLTKQANI